MPVVISYSLGGQVLSPGSSALCNARTWVLFPCLEVRMSCSTLMYWKEKVGDCDSILRKYEENT